MCVNDISAFDAIMECRRRGSSVLDDIAIAGLGNFEAAWCCHPTITAISVDAYGIDPCMGEALLDAFGVGKATNTRRLSCIDFSAAGRENA